MRPMLLHDQLSEPELAPIMRWFVVGAIGFVATIVGAIGVVLAVVRLLG